MLYLSDSTLRTSIFAHFLLFKICVYLVIQILRRGAHINDRDGLTDMTMLHYAAKSGAVGVGDAGSASETVQGLIEMVSAQMFILH